MNNLEKVLISNKPVRCEKCQGKLFHIGGGKYQCEKCENIVMDDFGKVKHFLEENGPSTAPVISQATGVKIDIINMFLKQGRVEITENSKYFLQCEKCGCSIRSGRFCIDCARELTQGIQRIFFNEVGDKPKHKSDLQGKMHFLNKQEKESKKK